MSRFIWMLFFLFPLLGHSKIYDCFPFFNELEILKMRLSELDEVVDFFVLVESIETQRGNPKVLFFQENKELFSKYSHKIIHVVVNERHPEFGLWEREHYQRNAILRGLHGCQNEDIILISDVDEIPRKHLIRSVKSHLKKGKLKAISFEMRLFQFHLNRIFKGDIPWVGTVATTYQQIKKKKPQNFREKRGKYFHFEHAGWHFTWMGGREKIKQKMLSVVEGVDDISSFTDERIDGWLQDYPIVPLDASFPMYILEHEQELRMKGFLAVL